MTKPLRARPVDFRSISSAILGREHPVPDVQLEYASTGLVPGGQGPTLKVVEYSQA